MITQTPPELEIIQSLKKWSGLGNYSIIFDSDQEGDGVDTLRGAVLCKKQLYFINYDDDNNVFGGYISVPIDYSNYYIEDSEAFIFSLYRKGVLKNKRYLMKEGKSYSAFKLWFGYDYLYRFGENYDLNIYKINEKKSFSSPSTSSFDCGEETNPMVDSDIFNYFSVGRIIVIQMY
ncbi:TLDc domain-containing protein [Entamoeba marina]